MSAARANPKVRRLKDLPPPSESAEQRALIQRCHFATGPLTLARRIFAIPNGGARHIVTAKRLRAEGVRPGVPDLMLPVARGGFHGLFLELKRRKGGHTSPEQETEIAQLRNEGYLVAVCYGADEAWQAIVAYLAGVP